MGTEIEFESVDEGSSEPAAPAVPPANVKQTPRQAALAQAQKVWAERKARAAPAKQLPEGTLSREDSRRGLKQTGLDNQDRLRKANLEALQLQAFRNNLQEAHDRRVATMNAHIKNARNTVPSLIARAKNTAIAKHRDERIARARQYIQRKEGLKAAHKHEQMGLGWSDPGKKIGTALSYAGKRLAAWAGFKSGNAVARMGHGVRMAGFGIASRQPARAIVTSRYRWHIRSQRRNENKRFDANDSHVQDLQKLAIDVAKRKNKIALARARHEHKATLATHNKAEQPLRDHRAQQAHDFGRALGHGTKALAHGIKAAVVHATSKKNASATNGQNNAVRKTPTLKI